MYRIWNNEKLKYNNAKIYENLLEIILLNSIEDF